MPFTQFDRGRWINYSAVGVDNVFILLSAWRSSPTHQSLQKRMEETFADAGVSITVTSLTDFISFAVGCATPFPSVQMFCAYAVTAVMFTYVYQLTFFAGIMVYTNRREMDNRNCITFRKIKKEESKSAYEDRSFEKNHLLSQFFRTTYSDMLLNPFVRVLIIIAFLIYLGVAMWGCTEVKLGLEPNDLLPDNSYGKQTLRLAEKYFADYGSNLHVWMYNLSNADIGPRRIWTVLDKEIELYEHTEFTGAADSWFCLTDVAVVPKFYTGSDHRLLRARFHFSMRVERAAKFRKRSLRTVINWDHFTSLVSVWEDSVVENIDEEYYRLVEHLHDSGRKAESLEVTKGRLSPEILELIRQRGAARAAGIRQLTSVLAKLCREAIKEDLEERRAAVLADAAEAGRSIRNARRSFASYKTKMTCLTCFRRPDGTVTASRRGMEKVIHDFYSDLFDSHVHLPTYQLQQDGYVVPSVLSFEVRHAINDILFDASGSLLDASRVPIQLRHVGFANQSRAMHLFRRLAETSKLPTGVYADFFQLRHVGFANQSRAMHLFRRLAETSKLPTGVYADFFQFAEQYNAVLPGTLSSIGYAEG
ncbi:patched family protein [Teladorsagia circumcincta]|uniref:Patched family protein n=1 Tax=Teladorsagia circumcincta TaxID=45464 RepID=A0A2G9UUT4_TELCI|nr:patched family protein [Teladorsagia circumcincta]